MRSREGSYELTSDFRSAKKDLVRELLDDLQRDLDDIHRNLPSGHSQRAVRIEDACCGHLSRMEKRYWQELIEPAPLSHKRRSELFRRAINGAFQEIGACARTGGVYDAMEVFRDEILRRDLVRLEVRDAEDALKLIDSQTDLPDAQLSVGAKEVLGRKSCEVAEDLANDSHSVQMSVQKWNAIEISFLSDERVQIRNGTKSETRNYSEWGFADQRNGKPNKAWKALVILAQFGGNIPLGLDGSKIVKRRQGAHGAELHAEIQGRAWKDVEKRIQEIRKAFRKHFGISANPIQFIKHVGYRAHFKIKCSPSFDT